MSDGLAMEAHDIDRRQRDAVGRRPLLDGRDMRLGHGALGRRGPRVRLLGAKGRTDRAADLVGIGNGEAWTERGDALAVGLDQGHVHAIDRGAAHQAEGTQIRSHDANV
jgi:hypothetical protein